MDKSIDVVINTKKLCKKLYKWRGTAARYQEHGYSAFNRDFTVFMGPSGSGKSTLLHMLSGMDRASMGKSILRALISQNTLKSNWHSFGG